MLARTAVPSVSSPHSRSSSGWAQNRPSRTPMPYSADRYAATRPAGWPATVKLCTATRSALSGQISSRVTPGTVAATGGEPVQEDALVRRRRPVQHRRERPAGLSERGDAEDVRGARLVPVRRGCPGRLVEVDPGHGAPAGEVGRRGVEPVAAADQRPRAERCVELVPGQRQVVHAGRGQVDPPVRDELCGVDGHPGARGVRDRDDRSSGSTSPVTLDAPVTASSAVRRARECGLEVGEGLRERSRRRVERAVRPCAPGQQVGVVLDVQAHHRPGDGAWPAGSARRWCCG